MAILSLFWPQKIASAKSQYNGEIKVIEFLGSRYIDAGGLMQSGKFLEKIFTKGFQKVKVHKLKNVKRVLVLGLGGGSIIKVIQRFYPEVHINAIDIDQVMVDLGKKYLQLPVNPNLHIFINDASNFIQTDNSKYDLIFVDLYKGYEIPQTVQTIQFLTKLKQMITDSGYVIFNRIYFQKHIFEADKFLDKLQSLFHYVITAKIYSNLFICVK